MFRKEKRPNSGQILANEGSAPNAAKDLWSAGSMELPGTKRESSLSRDNTMRVYLVRARARS